MARTIDLGGSGGEFLRFMTMVLQGDYVSPFHDKFGFRWRGGSRRFLFYQRDSKNVGAAAVRCYFPVRIKAREDERMQQH